MHALLWLLPGSIAMAIGLLMAGIVPRVHTRFGRLVPAWAGLATAVCGAWFVIGPFAWPAFESGGGVFRSAAPLWELGYMTGWSLGPGIGLILLGGCAVGLSSRASTPAKPAFVVAPQAPMAGPTAAAPSTVQPFGGGEDRSVEEGSDSFPASGSPAHWAGGDSPHQPGNPDTTS